MHGTLPTLDRTSRTIDDTSLAARIDACARALAKCTNFFQVRAVREEAKRLALLSRGRKELRKEHNRCGRLVIEAGARIATEKKAAGGIKGRGTLRGKIGGTGKGQGKAKAIVSESHQMRPSETAPTNAELGLSKREAARMSALAKISKQDRDAIAAAIEERGDSVTEETMLGEWWARTAQQKDDAKKAALFSKSVTIPSGLHIGDFRKMAHVIPDNSVEFVFTDPPWDAESIPLYGDAAREAARILKPGGSMIAYAGQMFLPAVIERMEKHLKYFWTCVQVPDGGPYPHKPMQGHGVWNGCRLLLWYVKQGRGDRQQFIYDTVRTTQEKEFHPWQQPLATAEHFIKHLTSENGVVCDFFAGSGTTAVAAKNLKRKWVAFEKDPGTARIAAARIAGSKA